MKNIGLVLRDGMGRGRLVRHMKFPFDIGPRLILRLTQSIRWRLADKVMRWVPTWVGVANFETSL